jgi:hypothetical protein
MVVTVRDQLQQIHDTIKPYAPGLSADLINGRHDKALMWLLQSTTLQMVREGITVELAEWYTYLAGLYMDSVTKINYDSETWRN